MNRLGIVLICCSVVLLGVGAAHGAVEISCVGGACNQFGTLDYNYILQNTGDSPVTVTEFYIASGDLDISHYSNFSSPAGFEVQVGPWASLGAATDRTGTGTFTDHNAPLEAVPGPTEGGVLFTGGSFVLQPGGTAGFGFNNGYEPYDVGWRINHPDAGNFSEADPSALMAGPWETFGWGPGFVHGPGAESVAVDASFWGRIKQLYVP